MCRPHPEKLTSRVANFAASALLLGAVSGCANVPLSTIAQQPPDPKVTQRIAQACLGSGLFKMALGVGGRIALGPAGDLPVSVINAGVDKVCADPAAFAGDVSTAEWVVKNTIGAARAAI